MTNKLPKVSIITAVFNGEQTVGQTITSIKGQTYKNIEHIIIDGNSVDNTLDVIKSHNYPKLRILSAPDQGIYHALNKGIMLSTGDIIGFVHSDDFLCNKNAIKKIVQAFSMTHTLAVYSDLDYVAQSDPSKIIRHWSAGTFSPSRLKHGWMPPHPTLYLSRSAYEKYGMFKTDYRVAADYEFILRVFSQINSNVYYIPETLYKMRTGGISTTNILTKMCEDYRAMRAHKTGNVITLLRKSLSKIKQFKWNNMILGKS